MSMYRGVNFHDLCRVCTSHTEQRISIFSADGKSKNLCTKIADSLSLMVDEKDRLPKVVCVTCLEQIEEICRLRNICKNSQNMLNDCLKQATQHSGGKVYIKDAIAANTGKSLSVMCTNASNIRLNGCAQSSLDVTNPAQYTTITPQQNFSNLGAVANNSNDILNSIMQSIGIQQSAVANPADKPLIQEYTITVDSKGALKTEPLQYKSDTTPVVTNLQNSQPFQQKQCVSIDSDHKTLTEFLKMKPNIKVTPLGKSNNKKIEDQQQPQQLQLESSQIIQQQEQNSNSNNSQPVHIHQQQPLSQSTTAAASLQLQQLQQQLQQFQLQQQLQQQIQQITSQLQPQSTITLSAPHTQCQETSPSKSKKPKLNFVLTSPTSQALAASLPQLAMNTGTQPPQIQLQLQAPQTQSQATAATLLSNLAPFLQQHSPQTHNSANILQTPTSSTTPTALMTSPNKCYLPITIKDENSDQQIVAHIDAKNFMLPTTYQLQMKLQPQIATVDGQPIMQLTPTSIPATLQLAAPSLSNQSFQTITGNMLQTIPSTIQSPPQQQSQSQQFSMKPTSMLKPAAQVTSQQILRPPTQFTNDVATSTNDQIEDCVPNKTDNNKQFPKEIDKVIKQQKYRLSQQAGSSTIEITPTTNFTQQIMQQVHKHQHQQQTTQELHKEEQQLQTQTQKQLQDAVTSLRTQSHSGVTVHRVINKSTIKSQQIKQIKQSLQQPSTNVLMQTKIPMLQKKDVTISRISNTAQTQQQQQDQQQALLKLLPTSKLDVRTKNVCATGTQMQERQPHTQLQSKHQDTQPQQNQTLNVPAPPKNIRKLEKTLSIQFQSHLHSQPQPVMNTVDDAAITIGLPHQQQCPANSTETEDTVKVKTEGIAAHGTGPNGLECSQCGRVFKKKEHLTQHVKLHAGLRPFKCKEEQCGKAFSRKEHLMRHEISHSGRKLFSCDVCHKPFSRKDNLNKHRRIHTTGSNIYNCEICNKQFAVRAYYEEHKQIHESPKSIDSDTNQKNAEKTTNCSNTVNTNVIVQSSQDANRQQQQPQMLQQNQQQQTQLLQQTQQQQTQLLQQPQQHQQQTHLLQHSQQQQQPALTAIPPSLMATNQPQTQQIQIVQHQAGNTQFQQQQQQHIMQLQLPAVVGAQDLAGNTITITQSHDPTLKATIGSHDTTVLNLPSSLANIMQLSHAQFVNTATGQIMGHIKIEK